MFNRFRKSIRPSSPPSPASFYSPGHTSPTFKESDLAYSTIQSSNFFPSPRHPPSGHPSNYPPYTPHKRTASGGPPSSRVPANSPELVLDIPDGSFTDHFSQDMLHSRQKSADKRQSNRRSIQRPDRARRAPGANATVRSFSNFLNWKSHSLQILPSVIEDIVPVVKYRSRSNTLPASYFLKLLLLA